MKVVRLRAGQGTFAAAPPPVGLRGQRRRRQGRSRRDGPRRGERRALPRLGRVQPALDDPPARLELRRGRAHRCRVLRAPRRAAVARVPGCRSTSDGVRLVHGEADGLPGLVVDRYGDTLSAQFLAAGAERWKPSIADALLQATGARGLYERSDTSAREREGLRRATGWLRGGPGVAAAADRGRRSASTAGASPSTSPAATRPASTSTSATTAGASPSTVRHFGFERVLNCYCYTGGFSVAALAGGAAHVTASTPRRRRSQRADDNVALQRLRCGRHAAIDADVNQRLRDVHRRAPQLRRDRPRPAEARADRRARRARGARLQGHQPARPDAAAAGRRAVHVLVLGRHRRRPVPQDRRRRRARCRRRRPDPRAPRRGAGPSDDADLSRRRVPEGPGRSSGADRRGRQARSACRTWRGGR